MKTSGFKAVAVRYVTALFAVAQEASAVGEVETDLKTLLAALNENPDFRSFLNNPLLPADARARGMLEVLTKMQVHQVTRQFIGMLVRQKRLAILAEAAALFIEWAESARGEMKAELVSPTKLAAKDIQSITDRLSKTYGRTINLTVSEDKKLLGGVVLKIGSIQLDSSLSGKLERLGLRLKAA